MIGLILSLLGASISFILLILSKKENASKRVVLIIATIGFLVLLGQQFLSFFSSKASDNIIKEIRQTTTRIDSTVTLNQLMLSKLSSTTIDKIGIELQTPDDNDNLRYFDKGAPDFWDNYYTWLKTPFNGKKAIRFIVNNNRHYTWQLILLYLGTNDSNSEVIKQLLESNWYNFGNNEEDWDIILANNPLCDIAVFEGNQGKILGFAKTKDLLLNLNSFKYDDEKKYNFENALNFRNEDFVNFASANLSSFKISIEGATLEDLGKSMINANLGETIARFESKSYILQISSLFKLE